MGRWDRLSGGAADSTARAASDTRVTLRAERLSERFHRGLYCAIQRVRGRPLARYIRQLETYDRLDAQAFRRLRETRLRDALAHAYAHVPLYRQGPWLDALRGDRATDLRPWPILTRRTLQARFDDLLARPVPSALSYRSTSGSTGTPLRIATDPAGAAWAWASDYRGLAW